MAPWGITKVNLPFTGLYTTFAFDPGTPVIVLPTLTFLISLLLATAVAAAVVASNALFLAISALSFTWSNSVILGTTVEATSVISSVILDTSITFSIFWPTAVTLAICCPTSFTLESTFCKSVATIPIVFAPFKFNATASICFGPFSLTSWYTVTISFSYAWIAINSSNLL